MNKTPLARPPDQPLRNHHPAAALVLTILAFTAATGAAAQDREHEVEPTVASRIPGANAVRPVAVIDREDIELSGAINVWDLVRGRVAYNSFGLHRPFVLGTARVAMLVDGRPASGSTSTIDLDALPISAIERIEILNDSAAAVHGGHAVGGAINIVLRHDFDGAEARLSTQRPTDAGGDAEQASAMWGGAVGGGHMVIGADVLRRGEIRNADRDYSRARWTPGGAFPDAAGVSVGGNTVFIPTRRYDESGDIVEEHVPGASGAAIARSVGDCTGSAYTGVLVDPNNVPGTGCGFAYDDIAWGFESRERRTMPRASASARR